MNNAASFVILLPDARRQTVKVTSDTSLLQILEDVCAKRGLNPNEWDLKHINREVDLGKAIRFTGLPNNATLEMVPSTKPRVQTPVTIVLQLESGKRLSHEFSPSDSLWTVIGHWASNGESVLPTSNDLEPVCIYMRQEIMGQDKLAAKTLKSLGLYQGKALIRLIHRSPSNSAPEQANVSSVLRRPTTASNDQATKQCDLKEKELPTDGRAGASNNSVTEKPGAAVKTAVHSPGKSNNQSVSNPSPPEPMEQEPPVPSKNTPSAAKEKETAVNVNANRPEATSAAVRQQTPAHQTTLASGLQQPTIPRRVELHCQRGDFHILGPNDALAYHADDVTLPEIETPPDDFFEVTVRDVESIYRSLKQKRAELEEAPLQISTKRAEERDNYVQTAIESHPTTIVRVRFPDRFVLQGTFRSTDSLAVMYDFVRQYLRNNRQSFYLFTVPPKKVLSETSTLVEENLIGYAVIYYGSQSVEPPILTGNIKLSDPERVFHYTPTPGVGFAQGGRNAPMTTAPAQQTDQAHDSTAAQPGSSRGPTTSSNTSAPRSSAGRAVNSNVVPKWFKK